MRENGDDPQEKVLGKTPGLDPVSQSRLWTRGMGIYQFGMRMLLTDRKDIAIEFVRKIRDGNKNANGKVKRPNPSSH